MRKLQIVGVSSIFFGILSSVLGWFALIFPLAILPAVVCVVLGFTAGLLVIFKKHRYLGTLGVLFSLIGIIGIVATVRAWSQFTF